MMNGIKHFLGIVAVVSLSLVSSSCDDTIPPDVMDEETMEEFLCDAYLIEGFYAIETGYHYEELTPEVVGSYELLLKEHGITREDFERSRDYYIKHPDRYKRIHDSVVARLDRMDQNGAE